MTSDVRGLSIGDLLSRLHSAILGFVGTLGETLSINSQVSTADIRELREHIRGRLQRNEDITDNQKLLKVLDLFATNKAVLELTREDADEWLRFIEDIERGLSSKESSGSLSKDEANEFASMRRLTSEIKTLIRAERQD